MKLTNSISASGKLADGPSNIICWRKSRHFPEVSETKLVHAVQCLAHIFPGAPMTDRQCFYGFVQWVSQGCFKNYVWSQVLQDLIGRITSSLMSFGILFCILTIVSLTNIALILVTCRQHAWTAVCILRCFASEQSQRTVWHWLYELCSA